MNNDKNDLVKWSDTFSCGVKLIDDQHKELINIVNEMFMHVTGPQQNELEYLTVIIKKLVKYVKLHFATEEKIMKATKYSNYTEHKKAHDSFIVFVIETINEFSSGKRKSLYFFTRFLKDWIFSHIAVMDKSYFKYFRKIASRKADGRLSISKYDVKAAV